AAGRVAGEAGRLDQALELLRQRLAFARADAGRKSDVMQQAVVVIESEQQRAHGLAVRAVAEAADYAIGAAIVLDLLHGSALARPGLSFGWAMRPWSAGPACASHFAACESERVTGDKRMRGWSGK